MSLLSLGVGRGLSPLARGTPFPPALPGLAVRFIPAGAGNTFNILTWSPLSSVYPRWRGEHHLKSTHKTYEYGLSPLARGTPPACQSPPPAPRLSPLARGTPANKWFHQTITPFIPAGAGNTWLTRSKNYFAAVYPRWRGEHSYGDARSLAVNRLSPLARGTHFAGFNRDSQSPFIPAGAGNTLNITYY